MVFSYFFRLSSGFFLVDTHMPLLGIAFGSVTESALRSFELSSLGFRHLVVFDSFDLYGYAVY